MSLCNLQVFGYSLTIDEQLMSYFRRHTYEINLMSKPVRFGFKLWCIHSVYKDYLYKFILYIFYILQPSAEVYLYKFILYAGASKNKKIYIGLARCDIILELMILININIYLTFFLQIQTIYLFEKQRHFWYRQCSGQQNEWLLVIYNIIFPKSREILNTNFDETQRIFIVKRNDNSIVGAIFTYYSAEPWRSARRYIKKIKKY